ncbi:PilN domain-containing protein [Gammaproteobacteria bacterium]|nr:PilN domain-containing protein [Gammaproteobacteria bacterium]
MRLLAAARRAPRGGKLLLLGAAGDLTSEIGEKLRSSRKTYSLVVPPGRTVFRRLSIPEVGRRKRDSALRLAAETVVAQPLDDYVVDYWRIDSGHFGLAAIPRDLLDEYREFADDHGQAARRIQVPELTADLKTGLVVWITERAVILCIWNAGALVDWQVIPRLNGLVSVEQMLQYGLPADLNQIVLRATPDEEQAFVQAVHDSCQRVFPKAAVKVQSDPVTGRGQGGRVLCNFDAFVSEQSNRPASGARRRGAVVATLLLLVSVSWFGYLQLRDLETQAARAEHSASLLKMQAARSARIAERVGRLTREVRELQALDDNSVVALLDDLTELMPANIRLVGQLQLDRRGVLSLDGLAAAERDISGFVSELRRHPQVDQVRLQSVTVSRGDDKKDQGARFRLQVRLNSPLWQLLGEDRA